MLGWRWGGAESCASPAPPSASQPPSEGRGLRPRSWLGLDAISAQSPASWLEAIFSLGPQACLPARWFSALTPLL